MILGPIGILFIRPIAAVLLFPLLWEINGIWLSIVAAEAMAAVVTVMFLVAKQKTYRY